MLHFEEDNLEDDGDEEDDDDDEKDLETSDETDDPTKPAAIEKRKKKLRLARLKKKSKKTAYEFTGGSDVVGIVFLDIGKITPLPPERNRTYVFVLSWQQMLNWTSNKDIIRHGSVRCSIFGPTHLSNSSHPAQSESSF